jgi:hypothetical protein
MGSRDSHPKSFLDRIHGWAGAISAAIAALSAIVAFLIFVYSKVRPETHKVAPVEEISANLTMGDWVPKVTLNHYLSETQQPKEGRSKDELRAQGNMFYVQLDLRGVAGQSSTLSWTLYHAPPPGTPVNDPRFTNRLAARVDAPEEAEDAKQTAIIWIPIPRPRVPSTYFARVALRSKQRILNVAKTTSFPSLPPSPRPSPTATESVPALTCGVERWDVKTLQDAAASRIDFAPRSTTIGDLVRLSATDSKGERMRPTEFRVFEINARLVEAKLEDDSDIKVVVADSRTGATMIVEFPNPGCARDADASARTSMRRAREDFVAACGPPRTSYRRLSGTAVVSGVAFFASMHGQRGVAPNGIELHPALSFRSTACRSP